MIVAELFALLAAVAAAPVPAEGTGSATTVRPTIPMAARFPLDAIVETEDAAKIEDLTQPAIFIREGRDRAIVTPSGAGTIA